MGIAIRTKKPLSLNLAPTVWKQLVSIKLSVEDIEEVISKFSYNFFSRVAVFFEVQ